MASPCRTAASRALKAPLAAFVRLAEPIPFESPDGQPVNLLFFLLIPDHVTQQHLEILSEIAEMFSDDAFRTALATDPDPARSMQRIIGWQPSLQALRLTWPLRQRSIPTMPADHSAVDPATVRRQPRSAATGLVRRLSRRRAPDFRRCRLGRRPGRPPEPDPPRPHPGVRPPGNRILPAPVAGSRASIRPRNWSPAGRRPSSSRRAWKRRRTSWPSATNRTSRCFPPRCRRRR